MRDLLCRGVVRRTGLEARHTSLLLGYYHDYNLRLLLLASLYYAFVKHKDFGPPDPEGLGVSPSAVLLIFPPSRLGLPWSSLVDTEGEEAGTRRSAQPIPIGVQPGLRRLATEVFFSLSCFFAPR